ARDGFEGLYCYPTLDRPALDAGGNMLLAEIEALIARYAPYSEEREQFAAALYGTSEVLKIDGEGRVSLTEPLKSHAGIADAVAFPGRGVGSAWSTGVMAGSGSGSAVAGGLARHIPVLGRAAVEFLAVRDGGVY